MTHLGARQFVRAVAVPRDGGEELQGLLTFAQRYCFRFRSVRSVDQDDIAQEAIIAYWRSRVSGTAIRSPRAFLVHVMKFLIAKRLRTARMRIWAERRLTEGYENAAPHSVDEAVLAHLRAEAPAHVRRCLDELTGLKMLPQMVSDAARWKRHSRARIWVRGNFS